MGAWRELAHQEDLYITYETAPGDVFPADIMEYFKFADVPMCEFWLPMSDGYVGSLVSNPLSPRHPLQECMENLVWQQRLLPT